MCASDVEFRLLQPLDRREEEVTRWTNKGLSVVKGGLSIPGPSIECAMEEDPI